MGVVCCGGRCRRRILHLYGETVMMNSGKSDFTISFLKDIVENEKKFRELRWTLSAVHCPPLIVNYQLPDDCSNIELFKMRDLIECYEN